MEFIVGVVIIWIVISCIKAAKSGELDMNPFVHQLEIIKEDHPMITFVVILFLLGKF